MGKKKQEMAQVYNGSSNEFIFEVQGGKGKNLSSFLKNLSLTGNSSRDSIEEANSNIYGSLSYKKSNNNSSPHINHTPSLQGSNYRSSSSGNISSTSKSERRVKYKDSDDDWDADIELKSKPSYSGPVIDSLYPDLTVQLNGENINKESMDIEDMKTKIEINKLNQLNSKFAKFRTILTANNIIDLQELRKLSWNGIPHELRALSWLLLLGYLPTNKARQNSTLKRKRQEYLEGISNVQIDFDEAENNSTSSLSSASREKLLYHQIKIDVKRTNPTIPLYTNKKTQISLRKVLYLWAIRHPASGYVQGINDLATPFYQLFLNNYLWQLQRKKFKGDDDDELFIPGYLATGNDIDEKEISLLDDPKLEHYCLDNFDTSLLSKRVTSIIEADTYWCLSRLLENITDNYIHEQPGIIRQVNELKNLMTKIDKNLLTHFENEGVEFLQFSFRWMNCLLMREMPINLIIRMWDTYLSEQPLGFNTFHTYVCAAFLVKFSTILQQKDFQEILLFLQNPPTSDWKEKDVEMMLSEAYIWQSLYKNASAHLR
ncbi:GYP1 [Candida pseudojiufengensis]|uniref:GYP1 n=1 Tax=Candida pseudojiufengensis TaxID=497109 RepID=UPI002224FC06|nr:GYP1 [Candida pseudojiufengensis]KAI5965835.1 GYP1 [Candida pseudojiufengensis]